MQRLRNIAWQGRAIWASLASFFKDQWEFDDYPIRTWFQPQTESSPGSRFESVPWMASVINWPAISAGGRTRIEALEELRERFNEVKTAENKLPRPGERVPLAFARTTRVDQHSELANDFFQRILEMEWAWISDESSLWDFHAELTNDALVERIRHNYGVDVSDISNGNLADIFERIAKNRSTNDPGKVPMDEAAGH